MLRLLVVAALLALALPAHAAGDVCAPSCTVYTNDFAFVTPATIVASGSTLTWITLAALAAHTATALDGSFCFNVAVTNTHAGSAKFHVADGALYAEAGLVTKRCAGATALPDGSFVLPYVCLAHSQMVGRVVVTPEGPL